MKIKHIWEKYCRLIIVAATVACMLLIVMNYDKFDAEASRRVAARYLEAGYWEGFEHKYIEIGNAGMIKDNYNDKRIITTGKEGYLVYGQYLTLPPGDYEVEYYYEVFENTSKNAYIRFDAVSDKGRAKLAESVIELDDAEPGEYKEALRFSLANTAANVEWRAYVSENTGIILNKMVLLKK